MKKLILIITLLLALQVTLYAAAFNKGEIKGKISLNGKPCSTAQVVLINEDMQTFSQTTNSQGYYSFKNLSEGKYLITVTVNNKFFIKYKLVK